MKPKRKIHPPQPETLASLLPLEDPEKMRWEMQEVQLAIARRAYELFEARGYEHGHERDDWFRAESELLRPVSVSTSETVDSLTLEFNVFGFEEDELVVSVEPRRIMILGKKKMYATETEGGKLEYIDWSPDLIMQSVELPTDVLPESAIIRLSLGILSFQIRKAAQPSPKSERSAA